MDAFDVLHWGIFVTAILVMAKSIRGFISFGLGDQWPSTFVRSVAFMYSLVAFMYQSSVLLERHVPPPATVRGEVTLVLLFLANVYTLWGLWWINHHPIGKMRAVYRHASEAMSISQLADVDPQAASELAERANELTAKRIMGGS